VAGGVGRAVAGGGAEMVASAEMVALAGAAAGMVALMAEGEAGARGVLAAVEGVSGEAPEVGRRHWSVLGGSRHL